MGESRIRALGFRASDCCGLPDARIMREDAEKHKPRALLTRKFVPRYAGTTLMLISTAWGE